jgi:hypothetical protein
MADQIVRSAGCRPLRHAQKIAWVSDGTAKPFNAIASVNAEYLSGDSGGLL